MHVGFGLWSCWMLNETLNGTPLPPVFREDLSTTCSNECGDGLGVHDAGCVYRMGWLLLGSTGCHKTQKKDTQSLVVGPLGGHLNATQRMLTVLML